MPNAAQPYHCPRVVVPRPDRIRSIGGTAFAWLDTRLARDHWLSALSPQAIATYTFLCLAANPQGVSWYRRDKIRAALGIGEDELQGALAALERVDLVAYQPFHARASEGFRQVLSLPRGGPPRSFDSAHLSSLIDAIGG
jgi:hypothetical protein